VESCMPVYMLQNAASECMHLTLEGHGKTEPLCVSRGLGT